MLRILTVAITVFVIAFLYNHQYFSKTRASSLPTIISIYLVRHGEREDQADRSMRTRLPYNSEPSLSPLGQVQAKEVAQYLKKLILEQGDNETVTPGGSEQHVVMLFSSPFYRCMQTASQISTQVRAPIHVEIGLMEYHFNDDMWTQAKMPKFIHKEFADQIASNHVPAIDLNSYFIKRLDFVEDLDQFEQRWNTTLENVLKYALESAQKAQLPRHESRRLDIILVTHASGVIVGANVLIRSARARNATLASNNGAVETTITGDVEEEKRGQAKKIDKHAHHKNYVYVRSGTCSVTQVVSNMSPPGEWSMVQNGNTAFLSSGETHSFEIQKRTSIKIAE